MSEKKNLNQEELKKVTGGNESPKDADFKPEDVGDALEGGKEEGPEKITDSLK